MSKDLVVRQRVISQPVPTIDDMQRVAKAYAMSGYWPDARDVAQAFVKVQFGYEVGLPAYIAMSEVHIIQGKPTLGSGALAALVKAHPDYDYRVVEHNDARCALEFFEDGQSVGASEFTMEHAKQAGLTSNPTYKKYPRNMLFARAISNGVAWYCPNVTMGRVYTPDEMGSDFAGGTYTPEELGDDMVYSPPEVSAGGPMAQDTVPDRTAERASSADIDQPAASASHTPPVADAAAGTEVTADEPRSGFQAPPGVRANCQHPPDQVDVDFDKYRCQVCGTVLLSRAQMAKVHAVIRELDGHAEADAAPIPEPWKDAESWVQVLKAQLAAAGVESRKQLTSAQAGDLIEWLEAQRVPFR